MENTNKDGSRGRPECRVRGGVKARGRGVRTRGAGVSRPSVYEPVFSGMVQNIPEGQPLETPIHSKKVRYLHEPLIRDRGSPSVSVKREKAALTSPKSRRCLISSSDSSRALHNDEVMPKINYGSEEESDEVLDEEFMTKPVLASRVNRIFFDEECEEDETEVDSNLVLSWPPQLHRPDACSTTAPPTPASPTPASPTLPSTKFHFEWRGFPVPQIEPNLRREPFSNTNCGPTVSFTSPYEAFTAIWDREIMDVIVRETNTYAQQLASSMLSNATLCPNSRITHWQDTDVNELYTYLAIVLAMGVVVKTRLDEYWNTRKDIFSTPGFSKEITFDRFLLLSKCLHFNNNENRDITLLTRPQVKLFKIQPVINHLNTKFSKLYNLSQNVAVDESLTMCKGLLEINQFVHNKAATVGIKTYEVCESRTGYLWRFEIHAGHDTSVQHGDDPVSGIVPALVLRLLNGLEYRGHTVWMDNFYNSPALARELKSLGFDCVGTLRPSRQFVPSELASITEKDMAVGQVCGCTSGDVDLMVWRDKKLVGLMSTYHGLTSTMSDRTLKPTVVLDYNVCMGGVDRKDQCLAMYPVERSRTKIWYKKFFRRLLNISVYNSYILLENRPSSHRTYRKVLINDLLSAHRKPTPNPTSITSTQHYPAQYECIPGKRERMRRRCVICKRLCNSYCSTCDVAVCVFTCYQALHTSR